MLPKRLIFLTILPFDANELRRVVDEGIVELDPQFVEDFLRDHMFTATSGVMEPAHNIPRQHDARRQFVRLICDRARFLPGLREHLSHCNTNATAAADSQFFQAAEAMRASNKTPVYLRALMTLFVKEAAALAGGHSGVFTRGGWVRAPVTLTARFNGTAANHFSDAQLNLLALHDIIRSGADSSVISENEGLKFPRVITGRDAVESDSCLLRAISCAFGLRDAAQFLSLIRSLRFVVTRAVATKLLVLTSFMETRTSIIQCGPTGVS